MKKIIVFLLCIGLGLTLVSCSKKEKVDGLSVIKNANANETAYTDITFSQTRKIEDDQSYLYKLDRTITILASTSDSKRFFKGTTQNGDSKAVSFETYGDQHGFYINRNGYNYSTASGTTQKDNQSLITANVTSSFKTIEEYFLKNADSLTLSGYKQNDKYTVTYTAKENVDSFTQDLMADNPFTLDYDLRFSEMTDVTLSLVYDLNFAPLAYPFKAKFRS